MSEKINPNELQKAVNEYLQAYAEDIEEEVKESIDEISQKAKEELIQTSPKGKGSRTKPYHTGWSIKVSKNRKNKYHKVVWNRTNYQLTHLLEFGHATRNGKMTRAIPHIRPVEEKYKVEFTDLVGRKIRRKNK